jgi:hypothetical protein
MNPTHRQKQAMAAAFNPLSDAGVLRHVFTFLPGCWLFLGAVCNEWRTVCAGMADQQVHDFNLFFNNRYATCSSKTTLYSAAVASPATATLAATCGLAVSDNYRLQVIAGLLADMKTLSVLRELGMPVTSDLVEAVARSGRLDVLQHLLS